MTARSRPLDPFPALVLLPVAGLDLRFALQRPPGLAGRVAAVIVEEIEGPSEGEGLVALAAVGQSDVGGAVGRLGLRGEQYRLALRPVEPVGQEAVPGVAPQLLVEPGERLGV